MADDTEAGAVPPALTAAEWARRWVNVGHGRVAVYALPGGRVRQMEFADASEDAAVVRLHSARSFAATMALANAARDDADPGKLTWAMVDRMREGAGALLGEARDGRDEQRAAALRHDADALAALLPPREGA